VPLDRVRVAVNADMVGRLRGSKLTVYGSRTAPGLRRIVSRQNGVELALDFNWDIKGDSDHYSFFTRNVPFVMLHTGLHGDYHRPSDDVEKINNEGLAEISRLLFGIVVELADAPELGRFRTQSRLESQFARRAVEVTLPAPAGRLGLRWNEAAVSEGKIVVDSVSPGSAAAQGGIRPGDRIVSFAGHEISDARQFRLAVMAAANPVPVKVERAGETAPLDLTLNLPGEPVRLGVSWRVDDVEPGCVIVNRLTPGSPADLAGLRAGDRIHRICGKDFAGGDEFRELARTLTNPLILEVETAGQVRAVEIPSLETAQEKSPAEDASAPPTGDS
jgi:membrane-associated protease RseP (regulator of RpoE activity)